MGFNSKLHNHVFYDVATTTAETSTCIMPVDANESTLNLSFVANGTFTAKIYASIINTDNFYPYLALKYSTLDMVTDSITDGNSLYTVDLTGIDYIKVVLTSLSGTISVYGKAVG